MKKFLVFTVAIVLLAGCKKTAEKIAEDLVIKAMTDGQWKVSNFVNNFFNDFEIVAYKIAFGIKKLKIFGCKVGV